MAHKFRVTGLGMVLGYDREDAKYFAEDVRGQILRAVYSRKVREGSDCPSGYRVYKGQRHIGWIATDQTAHFKELLVQANANPQCAEVKVVDRILQSNGYPSLMVEIQHPTHEPSAPPQQEKTEMKTPSLQDLVTANLNAATNAAKLELGAVANDRLAKIIGKRVPAPYKAVLGTPAGHLLLANAVMVAGKAIYPDNKNLGTVSNAMVVSSYQELIKQLDIPGILDELMGDKDIAKALAQEGAKDE